MMNSVYKKIVLVCVTSLAANQAALAIPSFWSWVKGNQKTTAAIVAGFAAFAVFARWMSKPTVKKIKPVLYVPVNSADVSDLGNKKHSMVVPVSSKRPFAEQHQALSEALAALTNTPKGFIASEFDTRPNLRILTPIDSPKLFKKTVSFDKPAGCVVFAQPVAEGDPIVIEYMAASKSSNKKEMIDALLATHEDIALSPYMDESSASVAHDFIEQRMTALDGVKPEYENRRFKRNPIRYDEQAIQEKLTRRVAESTKPSWTEDHLDLLA